jgi:hypothetical protein
MEASSGSLIEILQLKWFLDFNDTSKYRFPADFRKPGMLDAKPLVEFYQPLQNLLIF